MPVKLSAASGGSVTIEPTNTASNYTLTVPATNATLAINGPAFSAYGTALQSATSGVFVKIAFNTEDFDTNNNYDSTTNYRFTPTIAGYYQINASITGAASASSGVFCGIYKNGSRFIDGTYFPNSSIGPYSTASGLVYLNGTTDYVEIYGYQSTGGALNIGSSLVSLKFTGAMVRAA